jgi:hypothetical protein
MKANLKITEGADPNYTASIVKISNVRPHPNADRLEIIEIFGNDVVVGKGQFSLDVLVVYFPVECAISRKFLSWANLLDKAELNADGVTKGFFGAKHGRVRAISLRSIPSQGFLFKVSELAKYYEIDEDTFKNGDVFDTVGDDVLVAKYVKGTERNKGENNVKMSRVPNWLNTTIGVLPRPIRIGTYKFINAWYNRDSGGIKSQIVDGEFKFHYKTENGGRNIFLIKPDDFITITEKKHGTSSIYANVLCKKKFSPLRTLGNLIGLEIPTIEYKFIYSSRSVIKTRRDGKFTDDVWGLIAAELNGKIPQGYSVFGELVGYTPGGKMIQKNYDYSVPKGECKLEVYRITYNLSEGKVKELEWYEIEEFCYEHGLTTVPIHYSGLAGTLFDIPLDKDWNNNFLTKLKEEYLDKTCKFCTTGVVNEGVVLRIESSVNKTALKFKSPRFTIQESAARDNNEEDMEEES